MGENDCNKKKAKKKQETYTRACWMTGIIKSDRKIDRVFSKVLEKMKSLNTEE